MAASWTYRRCMSRPKILLSEIRVLSKEFWGQLYLGRPWRLWINEYLQISNQISSFFYFYVSLGWRDFEVVHQGEIFIPRTVSYSKLSQYDEAGKYQYLYRLAKVKHIILKKGTLFDIMTSSKANSRVLSVNSSKLKLPS